MLKALYPASFRRYSSLAILGPMVDGFSTWLLEHHYNHTYIKQRIWLVPYIEAVLSRHGIHYVKEMFRCSGSITGLSRMKNYIRAVWSTSLPSKDS